MVDIRAWEKREKNFMSKRLNENERKKLLQLQLFYFNVKKELGNLEVRLGIQEEKKEPLGIFLQIKSDENQNR